MAALYDYMDLEKRLGCGRASGQCNHVDRCILKGFWVGGGDVLGSGRRGGKVLPGCGRSIETLALQNSID